MYYIGPGLKTEVTYKISLVRPCVCPRHDNSNTMHWIVLKSSGKFGINVALPDFFEKKVVFEKSGKNAAGDYMTFTAHIINI